MRRMVRLPVMTSAGTRGFVEYDLNELGSAGSSGDKGPTGDAGPQGPIGEQGPQGAAGPQGLPGPDGAPGADGQPGANGQAGANGLPGADGLQGPVGDKGPVGDQGPAGDPGAASQAWADITGKPATFAPSAHSHSIADTTGLQAAIDAKAAAAHNHDASYLAVNHASVTNDRKPGFVAGDGGAVTQQTNKTTGVTLNKRCGQITMNGAALAAAAEVTFTVTNNTVASTDVVVACVQSVGTAGAYLVTVGAVSAGSFQITVSNASAGSLSQAVVLNFVVIKSVAA